MEKTFKSVGEYEYDGITFHIDIKSHILRKIKEDFKFKDDDIVLITYPKSGTTWMRAIMKNVKGVGKEDQNQDLCYQNLYSELSFPNKDTDICDIIHKVPLELTIPYQDTNMYDIINKMPSPRMIKSHLPFQFLERALTGTKAKVIFVMRNPKDTMVSYYYYYQNNKSLGCFPGSFGDFFNLFMKGRLIFGDWFNFIKGYWAQRDQPNFLFVKYEDIKADPLKIVNEVADFIGRKITTEQAQYVVEKTSFTEMKPSVEETCKKLDYLKNAASFMRKGIVGDWKSHFTVEQNEIFEREYCKNMKGCELEFIYE